MNLFMLRHSAGYEHSYLPHAEVAIKQIARKLGFENVVTTHQCQRLSAQSLEPNDVLVLATTGELPLDDAQKQAMLDFVRGGKGLVGIHNATDTFYKWPEYGQMLGGYFNGHPWTQEVTVKVEDHDHPATAHFGPSFKIKDEIYVFKDFDRSRTRVLMSLDNGSVDLTKGNRSDQDYALGWCHPYGKGRVMYSALGHFDELWSLPWFLQHIEGCIKWAARIEG